MAAALPAAGRPRSEDAILKLLAAHFENSHPRLLMGRGDDCAIIKSGGDICVSSDLFLEDTHFRKSYFTAGDVGHKALAVNISDLAGFGARPLAFTLCLGLPDWVDMAWLDEFFTGMAALARGHRMALAGGDLSRSSRMHISITVFGEGLDGRGFLTRGGSMPGDKLFLVGDIGLARAGLAELEVHGRGAMTSWPRACAAHLRPEPKTGGGLILARSGHNARPPALMDVSDGVLRDLPRLLGKNGEQAVPTSSIGARLHIPPGQLHPELVAWASRQGRDPVLEALLGGEDYALLGSCAPDLLASLKRAIPGFQCIGEVIGQDGIWLDDKNLASLRGFDHFDSKKQAPANSQITICGK